MAKKQVTKMIREVIDDLLVGQLDKMTNTLKETNSDFHEAYYQARIIIDLGTSSTMVRGTVKDGGDVPLIGVQFRVLMAGTDTEVKKVFSEVKGVYRAAKLPTGFFDLEWSFAGYDTVNELNVKLTAGKDLRRNIVMVASSGTVTVWEGNLGMGMTGNVKAGVIENPDATVKLEAFMMPMNFFASGTPNGGATGAVINVSPGIPVEMKLSVLAAQIGWNAANSFLNVQNGGMMPGAWKVTVTG